MKGTYRIIQGNLPQPEVIQNIAQNLVLFGELDEAFGEEQLTIDFPDRRRDVLLSGSDVRCLDRVIYHRGTGYYWYRVGRTSRTP